MKKWEIVVSWVLQIIVLSYAAYATFHIGQLKDEQIKTNQQLVRYLEATSSDWKDRSDTLKENLDRIMVYVDKMKKEQDKLVDKCHQNISQESDIENITSEFDKSYKEIDDIFRKVIPVSNRIKLQEMKAGEK